MRGRDGVEIEIGNGQAAAADALHIAGVVDLAQLVERLGTILQTLECMQPGQKPVTAPSKIPAGREYTFSIILFTASLSASEAARRLEMVERSSTSPPEDRAVAIFVLPCTTFATSSVNWAGMAISALTMPRRASRAELVVGDLREGIHLLRANKAGLDALARSILTADLAIRPVIP